MAVPSPFTAGTLIYGHYSVGLNHFPLLVWPARVLHYKNVDGPDQFSRALEEATFKLLH
jgi:hypothetical protein